MIHQPTLTKEIFLKMLCSLSLKHYKVHLDNQWILVKLGYLCVSFDKGYKSSLTEFIQNNLQDILSRKKTEGAQIVNRAPSV